MTTTRTAAAVAAAGTLLMGAALPATAEEPTFELVIPAGEACSFPLAIAVYGSGPQVYKEWTDRDGDLRTLSAGRGSVLTYTNLDTEANFSTKANGGATRTALHPDGSVTLQTMGHNVILMSSTDVPGPSATIHTGRVVIEIGPYGTWTLTSANGGAVDICAALDG